MTTKSFLGWLYLIGCLEACMDPAVDSKLTFVNASKKPILVYYTTDNGINLGLTEYNPFHEFQAVDTTRGYQVGLMRDNPNYIAPGKKIAAQLGMGSWEGHIGKGKLWVYRFKPETVLTNEWNSLRRSQKWDKVYSFSLEQVEAKNWVVELR